MPRCTNCLRPEARNITQWLDDHGVCAAKFRDSAAELDCLRRCASRVEKLRSDLRLALMSVVDLATHGGHRASERYARTQLRILAQEGKEP